MSDHGARPSLLLIEPQFLMRHTVTVVAKQLGVADIHEATHHEAAMRLLMEQRFDGMLADIGDDLAGIALVQQVREGGTLCASDMPIALMAGGLDEPTVALLKVLNLRRVMLKPFKVKTVIEVLSSLVDAPVPA